MARMPLSELRRRLRATPAAEEVSMMLRGSAGPGGDAPPDRIRVMPWGKTEARDDYFVVTPSAVASMKNRNQKARRDRIRIDREHATAFVPAVKRNPKDILGYGDFEVVDGEGIFLANIQWTDSGRENWKALPDVSPAFLKRKSDGMVTELESVGLCSDGELEGLHLYSASAAMPAGVFLSPTNEVMNELIIQLLKKLGIDVPAEADEATLRDLALKALEGSDDAAEVKPKPEEDASVMSALAKRLERLERTESDRTAARDAEEIAEIQRTASAEGKVIPMTDEQIKKLSVSPAQLRAMVGGLPAGQVPMGGGGGARPGATPPPGEKATLLSASDKHVAKVFGLPEEEVAKAYAAKP